VQSEETIRKLGVVDRELIEKRIHAMARLHSDGNLRGMLDLVADDIVFNVRGNWLTFPYTRPIRGKKQVAETMAMIAVQFQTLGSVIHELVIDGDRVAVRRTAKIRHRGTGKVGEVDIAGFIRFRDGLVVELTEIADSAVLAELDQS
jgi:ketosteroid isomerase-like protein